jgi:hypothetical protein
MCGSGKTSVVEGLFTQNRRKSRKRRRQRRERQEYGIGLTQDKRIQRKKSRADWGMPK